MFSTNASLLDWLQKFADPALLKVLPGLNDEQLEQLRGTYNEYGRQGADFDLTVLATALGRAVPGFMEVAKKANFLDSGPAQKAFVVENVVALFRLVNGGLEGTQQQFMASEAEFLPQAFPNGVEADLVRPLADQAVEAAHAMKQKLANP